MTANQRVAANFRALRIGRRWSQEDAGRPLGWSAKVVSAFEAGAASSKRVRKIDADDLAAIADLFGVGVSDLLSERACCPSCGQPMPGVQNDAREAGR